MYTKIPDSVLEMESLRLKKLNEIIKILSEIEKLYAELKGGNERGTPNHLAGYLKQEE